MNCAPLDVAWASLYVFSHPSSVGGSKLEADFMGGVFASTMSLMCSLSLPLKNDTSDDRTILCMIEASMC